jgi:transmembrane sensor
MEVTEKLIFVQRYYARELSASEEQKYLHLLEGDSEIKTMHTQVGQIWSQPAPEPVFTFDKDRAFQKHLAILQAGGELSPEGKEPVNVVNVDKPEAVIKQLNSERSKINPMRWLGAIAAASVLVFGAMFVFNNEKVVDTLSAANQASVASLIDGTQVNMNQGSTLDVYSFGKTRKVALKGEAYFSVKSNPEQPFVVSTDLAEIKVLGTKFTVSTIDKTVNVQEGKVEVTVNGVSKILTADQKVSFVGGNIGEPEVVDFEALPLWFNNDLTFNNAPFDKVVADLSKFYNIKFELPQSRDWKGCTFTASSLKDEKFEDVLLILQLTYELQYAKINETTYKLSKVRCR